MHDSFKTKTGLKVGETLGYGYSPLRARQGEPSFSSVIAPKNNKVVEDLGIKLTHGSMANCELAYVSLVLGENVEVATQIELMKKAESVQNHVGDQPNLFQSMLSYLGILFRLERRILALIFSYSLAIGLFSLIVPLTVQ